MAHKSKTTEETITQGPAPIGANAADPEALRQEIQMRAYCQYCERGYASGADVDDWLAAEQEVLAEHVESAA